MLHEHPYFTIPFSESLAYKPNHLIQAKPKELIDYLIASHRRFEYQYFPRIEQQFIGLIKLYPNLPILNVTLSLFVKFQIDLQLHTELEEKTLYKDFLNPKSSITTQNLPHEDEEPYLTEIIALLEKQSCVSSPFGRILLTHLKNFDRELKEHAWLEENLVIQKMK